MHEVSVNRSLLYLLCGTQTFLENSPQLRPTPQGCSVIFPHPFWFLREINIEVELNLHLHVFMSLYQILFLCEKLFSLWVLWRDCCFLQRVPGPAFSPTSKGWVAPSSQPCSRFGFSGSSQWCPLFTVRAVTWRRAWCPGRRPVGGGSRNCCWANASLRTSSRWRRRRTLSGHTYWETENGTVEYLRIQIQE